MTSTVNISVIVINTAVFTLHESYFQRQKYKTAKPLLYTVYRTRNRKQLGRKWLGKREVLIHFRKTVSIGAEMTSGGRLLQRWLPSAGNARSPTVDSRVCRITSCEDDDNRRRWQLESVTRWM